MTLAPDKLLIRAQFGHWLLKRAGLKLNTPDGRRMYKAFLRGEAITVRVERK